MAVVGLAAFAALLGAPTAGAEQAGSKQKRLPMGFIGAGQSHSCAVLGTGVVRCWGRSQFGQLGYGNTDTIGDNETPGSVGGVNLGSGRRARAISLGASHTCAILDTGAVRCWGDGGFGRLGYGHTGTIGDNEAPAATPVVKLGTGRRAVALAAGTDHTCSILDNGKVRCWGFGADGQLGYGNTTAIGDNEHPASAGPVNLGSGRRAVAIAAGLYHTCVIVDTGRVRCWGWAGQGALGYGNMDTIGDNEAPVAVSPVDIGAGRRAVAIAARGDHTCVILDTGRVRCWGNGANGRLGYGNTDKIGDNETPGSVGPVELGTGRKAVAISVGDFHTCALLDTGQVFCWGLGSSGQLGYGNVNMIGDNETPASAGPVNLGVGRRAVAVATGNVHSCALLDNGKLRCWGEGLDGRLGYGNVTPIGDSETPAAAGPVSLGGLVATKVRPALSLVLSRRSDRAAPFTFRASGKLRGFIADPATCSGRVVVRARKGASSIVKRPALRRGPASCSYAVAMRVASTGRWTVKTTFPGNGSLRSRTSTGRVFRAG